MSLVLELQAEAVNGSIAVDAILRKALVVARKLRLSEFESWVNLEMNGYSGTEVPGYRVIQGELVARRQNGELIPFFVGESKAHRDMTNWCERGPIGVIQSAVEGALAKTSEYLVIDFPQDILLLIMKDTFPSWVPVLRLNKLTYVRILDSVRNAILDWSLRLEKDGILGEGMSFTQREKEVAHRKENELAPVINIINVENMISSSIQQASPYSNQSAITR